MNDSIVDGASVLGIDAGLAPGHPSGVALLQCQADSWVCLAAESSVTDFCLRAGTDIGSDLPTAEVLLPACAMLGCSAVDVVAIDMPLSKLPITARRAADNAISRAYGGRKCSTHSPSPDRPGQFGELIHLSFERCGYTLETDAKERAALSLIEVYPHPALIHLAGLAERLPYKVAKRPDYWPSHEDWRRKQMLTESFSVIHRALSRVAPGLRLQLPAPSARTRDLKRFEDLLDALICAAVGAVFLRGQCEPFGDHTAAIWVPTGFSAGARARAAETSTKFVDPLRGYALEVMRRDGFKCRYCGLDGTASFANWLSLSIDHLLPEEHLDRNHSDFIVCACNFCSRADRRYFDLAAARGLSFTGLTQKELIEQRRRYVVKTRARYREFWQAHVRPSGFRGD